MTIKEIYKVRFQKYSWNFIGTLRNAKKFKLRQQVFVGIGNEIFRGVIIGIELPPEENPDYTYKIQIPEEIADGKITVTCDRLFNSIEEAELSALENAQIHYDLEKKEIENYFNQFREQN